VTAVIFECAAAFLLLTAAVWLLWSLHHEENKSWNDILEGMADFQGRLASVGFGIFSEGIECLDQELWDRIAGRRGLLTIFNNCAVLLEAVSHLRATLGNGKCCESRLSEVHEAGKRLRLMAMLCLFRTVVLGLSANEGQMVVGVVRGYQALSAHLALAINDFAPDLLPRYRYFVNRS